MKVLITGTDGYLGSLLAPALVRRGFDVVGLDTGFYKDRALFRSASITPYTLVKDIRHVEVGDFKNVEAVVHMAELSNDPLGELNQDITYQINHKGSVRLAEKAKKAGVKKFVYMSSCSVYGVADGDVVDEASAINPQTAYAMCKTLVERDVSAIADEHFAPTFLRNATAYGASPRMRFDIVLNNLAGMAWTTSEIRMTSDGTPWRPLVHGLDICQAIAVILEASPNVVSNQVYNVGDSAHNYTVRHIAEIVAKTFPGCQLSFGASGADNRSYKVSFEKIRKHLPAFKCAWDAEKGAKQLYDLFSRIEMTKELFEDRTFTRLKQLKHLIKTGQIDQDFFWKDSTL
jgi:nucleoside-diphosphate-sugar epimerase